MGTNISFEAECLISVKDIYISNNKTVDIEWARLVSGIISILYTYSQKIGQPDKVKAFGSKYMLENTERAIKNEQSRETDNIGYTWRRKTKQKHNAIFYYYLLDDTSDGGLLVPKGIIRTEVNDSAQTWFIRYLFVYLLLIFTVSK
jgi:hypothetical protein